MTDGTGGSLYEMVKMVVLGDMSAEAAMAEVAPIVQADLNDRFDQFPHFLPDTNLILILI